MDPNSSTEQVHLFLAEYKAGRRVSEGGGLAEENTLRLRRPELFGESAA